MDILQALKENSYPCRLVYSAKLPFIIKVEIQTFHKKQNVNEFMTTKPIL
jgi:hypothetical protein